MRLAELTDLTARAQSEMTVCNACRYCEQYCPVFPAIEERRVFTPHDLAYLANLCHNCGECLYACQYAPPHPFGVNLPRTLAQLRSRSYEEYCWPRALGVAFRRNNLGTALAIFGALVGVMLVVASTASPRPVWPSDARADFYAVIPHGAMVALFGGVALFATIAMIVSATQFWRDIRGGTRLFNAGTSRALGDAMTLRHLHGAGDDCVSALETRTPIRRWFHHCMAYGFALCFASTAVAAIYHGVFGWRAPYSYTSLPVILGAVGGVGLVAGPIGLALLRRRRDRALADPDAGGLDDSLLVLLAMTSLTGLALLALRHQAAMGALLVVHLGSVLALFVTLPYSKFVHALYRILALIKSHDESRRRTIS